MQSKEITAAESITEILKFTEKHVANELVNVQRNKVLSKDEYGFKELYEHYLRKFDEKEYLEIRQFEE